MKKENITYLVDGQIKSSEDIIKYFKSDDIGGRQKIALEMISNTHDSILDLGCYSGHFVAAAKKKFPDKIIHGADYLNDHIEISRLLHSDIPAEDFFTLSAYDLEPILGVYDTILFQEVIEHLEGAAQSIKEINRVLKLGGELILSTPTAYYWRDMWQAFKYEILRKYRKKNLPLSDSVYFQEHEWNRHIYCWTPSTLYTLLKVNGFEYVTHEYCREGRGCVENFLLKMFPFFSPTIIIKVRKISSASEKII